MTIIVTRDRTAKMRHRVRIRAHEIATDLSEADGGEDSGPSPHDLYDAALASCKALTVLWYARRRAVPVEDIEVTVERDDHEERAGTYRLRTQLRVSGPLTDAQRQDLLRVAAKCPVHRLMSEVRTEIETSWADDAGG